MTHFNLLFETEEQEKEAKIQAKKHIWCKKRNKREKQYITVGTKMVLLEEDDKEEFVPCFIQDLCIDQIIDDIFPGSINDDILTVFYGIPIQDSLIQYRQDIFKDLENKMIFDVILKYWKDTSVASKLLGYSEQTNISIQKSKYIIDAIVLYINALKQVIKVLDGTAISKAFKNMVVNFKQYLEDRNINNIYEQSSRLKQEVEEINCTLILSNTSVEVKWEKNSKNYCSHIQDIFRKENANNEIHFFGQVAMTPFEIKLMELCEKEYSTLFKQCKDIASKYINVFQPFILKLQGKLNIILSTKNMFNRLKEKGFSVTLPNINNAHPIQIKEIYDMVLALKAEKASEVVTNAFMLNEGENGAWVTGTNQGGKTTFARSVGQTVYFAMLGFQVPALEAVMPLYNGVYTHFSSEENAEVSNGKLKEELLHIKEIDKASSENSFYILNEIFSSTSALDAFDMSKLFIERLQLKKGTVLCVTHIPSLSVECNGMVSLAASKRTYHITRKNAEFSALAKDIAEKYELSTEQIKERIKK